MKYSIIVYGIIIVSFLVFIKCTTTDPVPINDPPNISSLTANPDSIEINGNCDLICLANDPNNDHLSYTWESTSGKIVGSGSNVTWTAPDSEGTYTISCTVKDGNKGKDIESTNIMVFIPNSEPTIVSLKAEPDTLLIGGSSIITCIAIDNDKDALTYNWIASDGNISGTGETISYMSPDIIGTYTILCVVDDGKGGLDSAEINIEVEEIKIPTDGLIAYYPFNGNANDESGKGNNGSINGNSVQFLTGLFDQAIKFDNSSSGTYTVNDYVALPNISINEFSVTHWVRYIRGSSTSYDGCTYSIGEFPEKLFNIRIKNNGSLRGEIIINNSYYRTSLIDISDQEWHLITVTVNSDYMLIYNNNSKIDSIDIGFDLTFTDDFQNIALHRFNGKMSSRFTGELDNLRIYDRSLTPAEISILFNE